MCRHTLHQLYNFYQLTLPALLLPLLLPLLMFLLLTVTACSEKIPQLQALPDNATILAFGDSLTFGTGAGSDESYPAVLASLTGLQVINAGIPGEETAEGLERLPEILTRHRPDLVILCHGGNDILRKKNNRKTADNLRRMIKQIHAVGASVILLGVPEPKLFMMKSAEFYPVIAQEFGIPAETRIIPHVEGESSLKSDGIHPNKAGYRLIAEAVFTLLRKSAAIR